MKSCPTCNRTYPDDTLAFCLVDGSVLSAPFDPAEKRPPRTAPATEVLSPRPTAGAARPPMQSTIVAPPPQPPIFSAQPETVSEPSRSRIPWIVAAAAIVLAALLGVVLIATRWSIAGFTLKSEPKQERDQGKAPTPTTRSRAACGTVLGAALFDKWIQMGGENGKLGCPTTAETEAPASPQGSTGRWIQFAKGDGGYLIEHTRPPNDGGLVKPVPLAGQVFEVSGCMFKIYSSLGGTSSWLGFPTSDGRETDTGARQDFEGGYIVWDRKTYVCNAHKAVKE